MSGNIQCSDYFLKLSNIYCILSSMKYFSVFLLQMSVYVFVYIHLSSLIYLSNEYIYNSLKNITGVKNKVCL